MLFSPIGETRGAMARIGRRSSGRGRRNLSVILLAAMCCTAAAEQVIFEDDHLDLRVVHEEGDNPLELRIYSHDRGREFSLEEAVIAVPEAGRLTLPAGTVFGNEGEPLWVLPQSQNPLLPYLGLAAENLGHVLEDPLTISLAAVDGPGHFFMWQANQFGSLEVKMSSRDGIGENDSASPHIGSHEHQNWGFSTNGVYRITFLLKGRLLGAATNVASLPQTVTFHVRPLPESPFQRWQQENFGMTDGAAAPGSDPDSDGQPNLVEYAFGTNPKQPNPTSGARIRLVAEEGRKAVIEYTPSSQASDVRFILEASSQVPAQNWTLVGAKEGLTAPARFEVPIHGAAEFFRLRVELN